MDKIVNRPTNAAAGKESRTNRVPILLTDSEMDEIKEAANREGLSVASYVRSKAIVAARNAD